MPKDPETFEEWAAVQPEVGAAMLDFARMAWTASALAEARRALAHFHALAESGRPQ
jgi:hypothetical protein